MKVLLLGEYSNVHWTLAEGLRQLGNEVTVVSNGDFWKDYPRDIDVSRPSGHLSGLRLMSRICSLLPRLKGYDVVQLINPVFFELKAEHLFPIYRYLRRHNRKMVLGAFGMDFYWVSVNTDERPLWRHWMPLPRISLTGLRRWISRISTRIPTSPKSRRLMPFSRLKDVIR